MKPWPLEYIFVISFSLQMTEHDVKRVNHWLKIIVSTEDNQILTKSKLFVAAESKLSY